jgi:K+-transporting ATPase ATPase C chain
MLREVRQAVAFTGATMLLFGGAYHAVLWGIGNVAFPSRAEGSLLRRADGTTIGSRLIAQQFARREYFHPRPSGVDYNAASTGGSNLGPSNPDHLEEVGRRLDAIEKDEGVPASRVPSEMLTASGGGLDPHISPAAAAIQAARVASARGVSIAQVLELVRTHTEPPALGFLGRTRVNVLELNLALDATFAHPAAALR